ncbi:hypothetical protein [Pedobacter namyangjuensis]|uniref:hypothetical protein n=1 Tax=Pedobacter namyangjuensis TaxID=600626 RepID=UPI000DE27906|nr:hypothetical protein [Pedobacter namyangjuensis]
MEQIKDTPILLIIPTAKLKNHLIHRTIQEKGTFYLDDAIIDELAHNADAEHFKFKGIYPNLFEGSEDASIFKHNVEELISKSNSRSSYFKVKYIDDILFITYFYTSYLAEVSAKNQNDKYLDGLIDVFIDLLDSKHTPTESNHVWIPDGLTGMEVEVSKQIFNEDELKLNGGFKIYSRMVPPKNVIYHFANDRPILVGKRHAGESEIQLSERLSRMLNETLIKHIIEEHERANTLFHKELTTGYIDTRKWRQRTKPRAYERKNKILAKLINEINAYLLAHNKSSLLTDRRELIYDLLALLKMMPKPLKRGRANKASAIRYILKDNPL